MSNVIRTRSGTLEFRQTPHGPIVVMNGQHVFSVSDFLQEMLDVYYRFDLQHPGGSTGWLEELTGITLDRSCPLCDRPAAEGEATRCATCSIGRCPRCARVHDGSPLCLLGREYADIHRQMRGGDDFTEADWYFARKSVASSHIARRQH